MANRTTYNVGLPNPFNVITAAKTNVLVVATVLNCYYIAL